jgi:hypothetical protein
VRKEKKRKIKIKPFYMLFFFIVQQKKKKPFLTSQSLLFLFISYSPFIQTMESIPSPVGERVVCYVSSSQKSLLLKAMISTSIFIRPF